jgi:preprotein translocase subunit SecG
MFYTVLLVVHVIVTLLLVGVILLQRSEGDGMGLTSSSSPLMSARTSANMLTRTTAILATAFILTSLGLSLVHQKSGHHSIVDSITDEAPVPASAPAPEAPAKKPQAPSVPLKE